MFLRFLKHALSQLSYSFIFFFFLTCLPNILHEIPTAANWIKNIRRITVKINSARCCNKIKNSIGCSTNNPIICKNIFNLISFRFTFVNTFSTNYTYLIFSEGNLQIQKGCIVLLAAKSFIIGCYYYKLYIFQRNLLQAVQFFRHHL